MWIHAKPCLSKGNLGSVTTWLSLWFCPCSPVAETGKSGFRSTHELEKVWQLILLDQYLLSNVHYVVKSKSGIRTERRKGFSTLPLRRGENEVVKCMTFCLLLFLTPLSTFAVQIPSKFFSEKRFTYSNIRQSWTSCPLYLQSTVANSLNFAKLLLKSNRVRTLIDLHNASQIERTILFQTVH